MPSVLLADSIAVELGANQPWPDDAKLLQSFENIPADGRPRPRSGNASQRRKHFALGQCAGAQVWSIRHCRDGLHCGICQYKGHPAHPEHVCAAEG
ncbi:hypothetical protein MRX96_037857 [Rhipicephalus microplus]